MSSASSTPLTSFVLTPSLTITMRSHNAVSSEISVDLKSIPLPSAAISRTKRKSSTFAPISTPRVGSSSKTRPGLISSHFPMTTFCWLPPDRLLTGTLIVSVLIINFSTSLVAVAAKTDFDKSAVPLQKEVELLSSACLYFLVQRKYSSVCLYCLVKSDFGLVN